MGSKTERLNIPDKYTEFYRSVLKKYGFLNRNMRTGLIYLIPENRVYYMKKVYKKDIRDYHFKIFNIRSSENISHIELRNFQSRMSFIIFKFSVLFRDFISDFEKSIFIKNVDRKKKEITQEIKNFYSKGAFFKVDPYTKKYFFNNQAVSDVKKIYRFYKSQNFEKDLSTVLFSPRYETNKYTGNNITGIHKSKNFYQEQRYLYPVSSRYSIYFSPGKSIHKNYQIKQGDKRTSYFEAVYYKKLFHKDTYQMANTYSNEIHFQFRKEPDKVQKISSTGSDLYFISNNEQIVNNIKEEVKSIKKELKKMEVSKERFVSKNELSISLENMENRIYKISEDILNRFSKKISRELVRRGITDV
ncbi:hypothetical protein [Persephonella sp.]